jgi:hypothetical protein
MPIAIHAPSSWFDHLDGLFRCQVPSILQLGPDMGFATLRSARTCSVPKHRIGPRGRSRDACTLRRLHPRRQPDRVTTISLPSCRLVRSTPEGVPDLRSSRSARAAPCPGFHQDRCSNRLRLAAGQSPSHCLLRGFPHSGAHGCPRGVCFASEPPCESVRIPAIWLITSSLRRP